MLCVITAVQYSSAFQSQFTDFLCRDSDSLDLDKLVSLEETERILLLSICKINSIHRNEITEVLDVQH